MRDKADQERQHWMAVLAKTPVRRLEKEWLRIESKPEYTFLRKPETGAVMVQGRVGGTGPNFNLGEMTVTRCTVNSGEGPIGSAYVMGRSHRHAELAALFDSLLQVERRREALMKQIMAPLEAELKASKEKASRKAASTKVDFFTMVRGE